MSCTHHLPIFEGTLPLFDSHIYFNFTCSVASSYSWSLHPKCQFIYFNIYIYIYQLILYKLYKLYIYIINLFVTNCTNYIYTNKLKALFKFVNECRNFDTQLIVVDLDVVKPMLLPIPVAMSAHLHARCSCFSKR